MSVERLTPDDDLFLRARRVLGLPVVAQTVWRTRTPPDRAQLARLHAGLARGRLTRVVRPALMPGARDRWEAGGRVAPLEIEERHVSESARLAWCDLAASVDPDPLHGPAWALRAAPTEDGGGLVSFVGSHVVADGSARALGIEEALNDLSGPPLPERPPRWQALAQDLTDAASRPLAVARGLRRHGAAPTAQGSADRPVSSAPDDTDPLIAPTVVVECDARAWADTAEQHGGTANGLLLALGVDLLVAAGRVGADRPVRVSVPVSRRRPEDPRGNLTTAVPVAVPPGRDLGAVRAAVRDALTGHPADGTTDAGLPALLQLLPDPVVRGLAARAPSPLCLCSNLGTLPSSYAGAIGGDPAAVMVRGVVLGATKGVLRRRRGGLMTWWARHGDRATWVVSCLDPDLYDGPGLRAAAVSALEAWQVPGAAW